MDYAVIEIGGSQHRVSKGDTIRIGTIGEDAAGKKGALTIDKVLVVRSDKTLKVGAPHVPGASVAGTVIGQGRGPKVLVFKKKRRKQYRRTNGHRQGYTALRIDKINAGS